MLMPRLKEYSRKFLVGCIIFLAIFSFDFVFAQGSDMNLQKAQQEIQAKINQMIGHDNQSGSIIVGSIQQTKDGYVSVIQYHNQKRTILFTKEELAAIEKGEFSRAITVKFSGFLRDFPDTDQPSPGIKK